MGRTFRIISFWIIFISLPILLLLNSVEIAAFDLDFYSAQYDENQVMENTGIEKKELMNITEKMLDYLKGDREDLEVYGQVNGQKQLIFDERDQAHMVDVKELFSEGFFLRNLSLAFFLIALVYLAFIKGQKRKAAQGVFLSTVITIFILILLGMIVATDFSKYFDSFHSIFFDNDLWRLDPKESILIHLVPLGFFQNIMVKITLYFSGSLLICILLSGWYLRHSKKRNYIFTR